MKRNEISVFAFAEPRFRRELLSASRGARGARSAQVDYLARYCALLKAKTVLREAVYIDRHYLDEYGSYYGKMLEPPPHHVQRFHVFDLPLSNAQLSARLERAAASEKGRIRVERELSSHYLGFISLRPIPSVPVGRTVLQRLDDGTRRDIWATTRHHVHLANLTLDVDGLAFQQQDLAVGACATAAVWGALSRVARHEGMRAPTPAEVSEAATRHFVPAGRTFPAVAGLTIPQLCEAIRAFGFAPDVFRAEKKAPEFAVALHTYLLSGIPVVLTLRSPAGEGHAVIAAGFQMGARSNPALLATLPVRSSYISKLYIHDDRLGPYARAIVHAVPKTKSNDEMLLLGIDWPLRSTRRQELWVVDGAVAPVYPKMRLTVRSLMALAAQWRGVLEKFVGPTQKMDLNVEFQFKRGGELLGELRDRGSPRGVAARFFRTVMLPRWCASVRWHIGGRPVFDLIFDTTDIFRSRSGAERTLLRAVVSRAPELDALCVEIGNNYPWLLAA